MERRAMPAHSETCPFAPYAAGLSAAMEDLAVLRRLTAASLSEAIAATTSAGIHGPSLLGPGGAGSGLLPFPPAVIAEARNRLGMDHEWTELSETQKLAACQSGTSLGEQTGGDDQVNGKSGRELSTSLRVQFAEQNLFERVTTDRLEFASPMTSPVEKLESELTGRRIEPSRKGTRAEGINFVVTAVLPAPKRPGRDNHSSLTPIAEARGQQPAIAPFLASVGPEEGSLCLWYGSLPENPILSIDNLCLFCRCFITGGWQTMGAGLSLYTPQLDPRVASHVCTPLPW
jgi:hypothetical protein